MAERSTMRVHVNWYFQYSISLRSRPLGLIKTNSLIHLIRLKRYLTPFGAFQPISACFLPLATSHTKARRSLLIVTMRAPSGLKSRSSISFSCASISCVRVNSGNVHRRRKPSSPPVASNLLEEGLSRTHFWYGSGMLQRTTHYQIQSLVELMFFDTIGEFIAIARFVLTAFYDHKTREEQSAPYHFVLGGFFPW